jgi:hypothetical protein
VIVNTKVHSSSSVIAPGFCFAQYCATQFPKVPSVHPQLAGYNSERFPGFFNDPNSSLTEVLIEPSAYFWHDISSFRMPPRKRGDLQA